MDSNTSTKTQSDQEHICPTFVSIVREFNKDQTAGMKLLKQQLETHDKKVSVKEAQKMLEETKKNLAYSMVKKQELVKKEQALLEFKSTKLEQ